MKIKRIITLTLALVLCLGLAAPSASAADYSEPGISCTMDAYDGFAVSDTHTLQDWVDNEWKTVREGTQVGVVGDDTIFTVKNNSGDSNVIVVLAVRAYVHHSGTTYRLAATGSWRPEGSLEADVQGANNQIGAISARQSVNFNGADLDAICPDASYYIIDAYLYDTSLSFDTHVGHGWYVVTHDNERAEEIEHNTHVYDQQIASDEALKSKADCEDAAVYYLSCTCGKVSRNRNDVFAYGEPLGHEEAAGWKSDNEEHWKICEECREVLEDTREDHIDEEENGECDICERALEQDDDNDTGWNNPFTDILLVGGSGRAIQYVYENGLFEGVSRNEFAPHMTMTRGMFVTVLGRLAGIDTSVYGGSSFSDVRAGEWYAPGVAWASQNGIVMGYGDGSFGVNDEITVEQAVVMLARYAKYIGVDTTSEYGLTKFSDRNLVSAWALEQMQWAVEQDIYEGNGKSLVPQKSASRELVAELIYNFAMEYVDEQ